MGHNREYRQTDRAPESDCNSRFGSPDALTAPNRLQIVGSDRNRDDHYLNAQRPNQRLS
jgi:hypothetical protein